ncbi:MAG: hypothetical protein NZ841_05300 [Dictyoglomus sp.]|nr:hypothetical protein [Dictyoglomus sp.]MDW8188695.1 hypothetical protein [Dictyoglomus sp.]
MKKIDVLIFFLILLLGSIIFLIPSYSNLVREERNLRSVRKEMLDIIDELSKLKDTLNRLSKEREDLLIEGKRKAFDKRGFSIFLKELAVLLKKHKILSFSIIPEEVQDVQGLPEKFPLKIKRLPLNFQFVGRYQGLLTFFQDLELQNYPIRFLSYKITHLNADSNKSLLNFTGRIEIYLLEEE